MGLRLVLWKEVDMIGSRTRTNCRSRTFRCTFSIPKDPAGLRASQELAFKDRRLYRACISALPGSYCFHDKLVSRHLKHSRLLIRPRKPTQWLKSNKPGLDENEFMSRSSPQPSKTRSHGISDLFSGRGFPCSGFQG